MERPVLRLSEYGRYDTTGVLNDSQREAITDAAERWREEHRMSRSPLHWEGANGKLLCAAQYVGVVEAGDAIIEIYPKLDKSALGTDAIQVGLPETLLRNLLWMMEIAESQEPPDTDTGGLEESVESFTDLWALLLARRLFSELGRGTARQYVTHEDELHTVRGRIRVREQAGRLANRYDKIACRWDEFTADIPVNRVLRCACRNLRDRVRGTIARRFLNDCLSLLDDVTDVTPFVALAYADRMHHFDRTTERFQISFSLAVRLLRGHGHLLQSSNLQTFVFLTDMNKLWEGYVGALLANRFGDSVSMQNVIGHLLDLKRGGIQQKPDFLVRNAGGKTWIGDAKYKHLAKGQDLPLRFTDIEADSEQQLAGRVVSPDDVRQLTVYAELDAKANNVTERAQLLLLYPYVGAAPLVAHAAQTWNNTTLWLVPVGVMPKAVRGGNLPDFA